MKNPLSRLFAASVLVATLSACEEDQTRVPCGQGIPVAAEASLYFLRTHLEAGQECAWPLLVPTQYVSGAPFPQQVLLDIRYDLENRTSADDKLDQVHTTLDGVDEREPGWTSLAQLTTGEHVLRVRADAPSDMHFTLKSNGVVPETAVSGQSIELTAPSIIGDAGLVGLGRIMELLSDDLHGGRLFADLLARFETTAHSSRTGPPALLEYLKTNYGADPATWQLSLLPFKPISVQNRTDLRDETSCGQLRVIYTSTAPGFESFNLAFLFSQPPVSADYSPRGTLTCSSSALRWLSFSTGAFSRDWFERMGEVVNQSLARSRFLRLKTSERLGDATTFEFREWVHAPNTDPATSAQLPTVFVNRPMFQTVDAERVNADGELRTRFLEYVNQNAEALNARTALIPTEFLAESARASSTEWTHLDLSGVPPATLEAFPDLRKKIEVVGCTGCHGTATTGGSGLVFTHSRQDGRSSYLVEELRYRGDFLEELVQGLDPHAAFGPLNPTMLPP